MGPGQNILTLVGSGQFICGSGRVSHLWFGFEFGKFPLKMSNFSIFSLQIKKISSGQVGKYPGQRRVGLLLTAGQKKARVGSGRISSFDIIPGIVVNRSYIYDRSSYKI